MRRPSPNQHPIRFKIFKAINCEFFSAWQDGARYGSWKKGKRSLPSWFKNSDKSAIKHKPDRIVNSLPRKGGKGTINQYKGKEKGGGRKKIETFNLLEEHGESTRPQPRAAYAESSSSSSSCISQRENTPHSPQAHSLHSSPGLSGPVLWPLRHS